MELSKAELLVNLTKKWKEALKKSEIYNFDLNSINWALISNDYDESYAFLSKAFKNVYTAEMIHYLLQYVPIVCEFREADSYTNSKMIIENIIVYLLNPESKESQTLKTNLFKEALKNSFNPKDNTIDTKALIQDLYFLIKYSMNVYTTFALIFGYVDLSEHNLKYIFESGESLDGIRPGDIFDSFDEVHLENFDNYNKDQVIFNILVHLFNKIYPEIGKILEKLAKDEDKRYEFISILTYEKFQNGLDENEQIENEEGEEGEEVEEDDNDLYSKKNLPLIKIKIEEIETYAVKLASEYQSDLFFDVLAKQSIS